MSLRLLNLGSVSPIFSQAVYHGLAAIIQETDIPILILLRPDSPYISIGLHQDIHQEIDITHCRKNKIPVIRRHVGGGTVLLDQHQLFFQFVFPSKRLSNRPQEIYVQLLEPVLHCFQSLGIAAYRQSLNDIHVNGKKIAGTGAATIENATVLVGSFMFDFNYSQMANCINAPSEAFKQHFATLMRTHMTTINNELSEFDHQTKLISLLKKHLENDLSLQLYESELNSAELKAIQLAADELSSKQWTYLEGRKLVTNGVKIAAGLYLVERQVIWQTQKIAIRLLVQQGKIANIWLESEKYEQQLLRLSDLINQTQPLVNKHAISTLIGEQSSFELVDIELLANHIYQLAKVDEY